MAESLRERLKIGAHVKNVRDGHRFCGSAGGAVIFVGTLGEYHPPFGAVSFDARSKQGFIVQAGKGWNYYVFEELEAGDVVLVDDAPPSREGFCVRYDTGWLDVSGHLSPGPTGARVFDAKRDADDWVFYNQGTVVDAPPEAVAAAKKRETIPAPTSKANASVASSGHIQLSGDLLGHLPTTISGTRYSPPFDDNRRLVKVGDRVTSTKGFASATYVGTVVDVRTLVPPSANGIRIVNDLDGAGIWSTAGLWTVNATSDLARLLFADDHAEAIEIAAETKDRPDADKHRDRVALAMWLRAPIAKRQRCEARAARRLGSGGK